MAQSVLCVGVIVGDFMVKPVVGVPEKGKLTLVDTAELHLGGCAANTAVVLKNLGGTVGIMGKVGKDALGRFVLDKFTAEGIATGGIKVDGRINTSGTSVLIHPDGERSFIHSLGANGTFTSADIDFSVVERYSIVHVAGALLMPAFDGAPTAEFAARVKKAGKIFCLDTAWDSKGRWLAAMKDVLPHTDYFLPSIEEARMLTGRTEPEDVARFLLDAGVRNVGLKMGEQGSFVMNAREKHRFPALPISVVDTTGSGDAYVGGFLAGLVRGSSFERCGLLGNLAGAKIATEMGATSAVRSWDDLVSFAAGYGHAI